MNERSPAPTVSSSGKPALLYVATVAHTISHFLIPYATHFRAFGWRVDAAANGASEDPRLAAAFDHVYDLPLSRSILDLKGLTSGERAISQVLGTAPDIVHVHTPIASFVTRLAAHRSASDVRPRVVYTAHGFHFFRGGRAAANFAFRTAERVAGRWTDRLIVINEEDYEAARRYRIVPQRRLTKLPGIGIDTEAYARGRLEADVAERIRRDLAVPPEAPVFVIVGELNRNKRHRDVLKALALMQHRDAVLALAGEGPERAPLEALVATSGLAERVRFAGYLQDIRPFIAGATALILPSSREGLARSIMEALSLEVPVVASTARGNPELVGRDAGFVVPTGDVHGLANSMDWLIDHPEERMSMGQRGRARMVRDYDLGILIRRHEQLYRAMLGAPLLPDT